MDMPGVGALSASPAALPFAATAATQAGVGLINSYMQYKENQYQHGIQREIFNREDSAMQRRVADLKAAGLSPILAAGGSGAGAGAVVSTKAPQFDASSLDVLAMMKQEADISTTNAQKVLIDQQVKKATADTRTALAEAATKEHDLNIFRKSGTPSNASGVGKTIRDLIGVSQGGFVQGAQNKIEQKINEPGLIQKWVDSQVQRVNRYREDKKGGKK